MSLSLDVHQLASQAQEIPDQSANGQTLPSQGFVTSRDGYGYIDTSTSGVSILAAE